LSEQEPDHREAVAYGRSIAGISGTLTESVGRITVTKQGAIEDGRDGFSDLFPQASLRWNSGVNNWMVYSMGDIPVGTYDSSRLANLGIGHGAIDGGIGYTYFNEKTGHELSAVTGLTYNFMNPSTGYQNGVDWHLDWGASQFLTKTLQVGAVGYFYDQITPDHGCLQSLCPFESRTVGVGPQLGLIIPGASVETYINLKAYWDVDTQNRASGMSAWFTLSFSPQPSSSSSQSSPAPILIEKLERLRCELGGDFRGQAKRNRFGSTWEFHMSCYSQTETAAALAAHQTFSLRAVFSGV
jgi:hypothetical protein